MISLQPASGDIYELAVEQSREQRWAALKAAVPAIRTGKRISPAPDVLPFLVFEDGLGMLTPFVGNIYELLDGRGRAWMRKRGTYECVMRGLAFLGLAAAIEPGGIPRSSDSRTCRRTISRCSIGLRASRSCRCRSDLTSGGASTSMTSARRSVMRAV